MTDEELTARIDQEYRQKEKEDIERMSSYGTMPPMTEAEFDAIEQKAVNRYLKARDEGKANYTSAYDFIRMDWSNAAHDVNPVEWFRVWFGHYPRYYNSWAHSQQYNNKAKYYINKALACGLADNAADAVKYFEENK